MRYKYMKDKTLSKLFAAAAFACFMVLPLLHNGCANTTTPPSGGPKDTIPPVLTKIRPLPGTVNVPRKKTKLEFTFNEYVVVKDLKSIYLSPPLEKAPKYKMKGKTLVVYFESDLDSNTTYTLDITGAVADNNEGNMFPGYTLVFSTGDKIDSMMVTGIVQDCNTLMPVKGATVLLHKDPADSAVFLHRPTASAKTDDWGFFCVRNIQDTVYRVYAIKDENGNNIYEADNEKVAFLDSAFRPVTVVNDSLPELMKYDMKDTALCLARKTEIELNLFREKPSKQMIVKKERVGDRTAYLTFMAPNTKINSMRIRGIPKDKLISQFNAVKDSLELWVNDQRRMPDTLKLLINYDKTDTLGKLVPTDETVNLAVDKKAKAAENARGRSRRSVSKEDTTCVIKATADPTTVEQYGYVLEFKYPIIDEKGMDSLVFRSVNPRQQESRGRYRVVRDTNNLRVYNVFPVEKMLEGYDYFLKIPHRVFRDINGHYNDSTEVKVTLPTDEKLSSLTLSLSGVNQRYMVDLLNEKRDKVIRSFTVDSDCQLLFPYITAGKYCIRIVEDVNRNSLVDTGILLEHRQPEKVLFYKLDGNFLIDIPERTELEQELNLEEYFK